METSTAGRLNVLFNNVHFIDQLYFVCQLPGDIIEFGEDHGHCVLTLFHEDEKDATSRFAWNSGIFVPAGHSPHLIASLKEAIRDRGLPGTVHANKFLLTNFYPPTVVKPVLAKSSKFKKIKKIELKKHTVIAKRAMNGRLGKIKRKRVRDQEEAKS